jgi:Glycosyl transferases group 1/Glycosyl transferase 4-like domain
MRIVLVNWAFIWDGAVNGGGVNGYCQALALQLVELGHDVVYLSGGVSYAANTDPAASAAAAPCTIRRHPDWLGVRVFEVIDSPVVAPSIHQFADPLGEVASPALDAAVSDLIREIDPDVVHFHNIEGFTAGCVHAIRRAVTAGPAERTRSPRLFYSIHNYHTICPQVYLMQGHRVPCRDFRNGHACVTCISAPAPNVEIERRIAAGAPASGAARAADAACDSSFSSNAADASSHARSAVASSASPTSVAPVLAELGREIKALIFGGSRTAPPATATTPAAQPPRPAPETTAPASAATAASPANPAPPSRELPGRAVIDSASIRDPFPLPQADARGQTPFLLAERTAAARPGPADPSWQPLTNDATPEPPSDLPPTDYARRRAAMLAMLNSCDGVLAVSEFVRAKYELLGVDPARLRTVHIGTRMNRVAAMHKDVLFEPPPFDRVAPRPVRLVFIGFNNWYKGLPMLAGSLELMPPDELHRLHLFIYGLGVDADEWRFRRMEPRLGGLTIHPAYRSYDIPWILGGKDLGVVPSVWWDNAPQTVFEFFACGVPVLGADLGGIPDFVKDGHNGLLFRGNDRYHLAHRLGEVVREPWKLFDLRRNVRPPKDIAVHADELVRVYRAGVSSLETSAEP